jgi:hypothetical protein
VVCGGANYESSRSNDDQVKHSGLSEVCRQDQVGCARKRYGLVSFPFTGLKVVVGRPGYRIDSHTIKRGFRLGNLITSY